MFGPYYIKLLQFGLLFHFSPVFLESIVNVLLAISTVIWNQGWSVIAPVRWIIGSFVTLWLGMLPFQDDNPEPRWKRRNQQQDTKRQHKACRAWLEPQEHPQPWVS